MSEVQVDKYGNVMVKRADGKWVRDQTLTNRIKLALKRNTTGKQPFVSKGYRVPPMPKGNKRGK